MTTSYTLQKENLQKENIKNKSTFTPCNTLTSSILSSHSHNRSLIRQKPKISNNKATSHILQKEKVMQNTIPPNIQTLTKNYTNNITHATSASILSPISDNIHIVTRQQDKHSMTSLTSNYQFHNHTYLDKKTNYPKSIWSDKHYKEK